MWTIRHLQPPLRPFSFVVWLHQTSGLPGGSGMGLGTGSLPSRATGTDPHVTFPVVTVSGRHSLMLSVEGQ